MNVAAVIAEYNPFHNGHAWHLEETRRQTGADYILVIMSGDFVQRGEPAILDKYSRARMALQNGADLVLELPAAYACASAEAFAAGAVATLHRMGVADALSFGCEYPRPELFSRLARLYLCEPESLSLRLRELLRRGQTYPQARAQATLEWLNIQTPTSITGAKAPTELSGLLASPNSILAIEYHKALLALDSAIRPLAIRRRGSYHAGSVPDPGEADTFASASAIRRLLLEYGPADKRTARPGEGIPADTETGRLLSSQLPAGVFRELQADCAFLTADDFSAALAYALLTTPREQMARYADLGGALADRIVRYLPEYQGWQAFTDLLKTRQLTRSRVSRALLHLLLQLTEEQMRRWRDGGYAFYARVLGFRRSAAPLLSAIRQKSSVPLLTKMADAKQSLALWYEKEPDLQKNAQALLQADIRAAGLYEAMAAVRHGRPQKNEFSHGLVFSD